MWFPDIPPSKKEAPTGREGPKAFFRDCNWVLATLAALAHGGFMTMMSRYHRALCCLQLCRVLEAVATAAPPSSQLAKSSRPQPLLAVWW